MKATPEGYKNDVEGARSFSRLRKKFCKGRGKKQEAQPRHIKQLFQEPTQIF